MKLVVFDMDGTLLDTAATITSRVAGAFAAENLPPPPTATIRAWVGMTLEPYMAKLAPGGDADLPRRLVANYRAIAAAEPNNTMPLFEGAREVLDLLKARGDVFLGIATGKGRLSLDRALADNGIAGHFATIQTPDTNPGKPHPGMLLAAMAACGTDASNTVMIGDATLDVEMAVAAHVPVIGVAWGMHDPRELSAAGAVAIADRIDELGAVIDKVLTS